jgi:low temperature requirement protein LtrA
VSAASPVPPRRRVLRSDEGDARVSPLELFFDLVFVFALTKVTEAMAEDPTFTGLLHGMLVLVPLYWAWSGYTWLTSTVDPELVAVRIVMFTATVGMGLAALATPGAFGDDALVWGVGYLVVRALHVGLFAVAARGNPGLSRQVASLVRALAPATLLIILAGLALEGTTRDLVWLAAIVLDFGLILAAGAEGWVVHAEHFAERFGLVVIIALGESIVAIGAGTFELGAGEVLAAILALVLACLLWWAYFDVYALMAERRFVEAVGGERLRLARDSYALLHLPMIAGIVLFALGVKKSLEHVDEPLKDMPAVALCGGLALYALTHVALRLRSLRTLSVPRLVAAALCVATIPVAVEAPALTALAVLLGIWAALIAVETIRERDLRTQLRSTPH